MKILSLEAYTKKNEHVRFKEAARLSGVDQIAAQLEHGFETILSKEYGGTELSGGQWQKVAIARAMVRNAQIVILDEPTAALDPLAELSIFEEFRRLSKEQTAFLISHRIGTARNADRILVLQSGELIESGNHEQLIKHNGEYATLFRLQAQWYADEEGGETK